jgi:hypothetical protein
MKTKPAYDKRDFPQNDNSNDALMSFEEKCGAGSGFGTNGARLSSRMNWDFNGTLYDASGQLFSVTYSQQLSDLTRWVFTINGQYENWINNVKVADPFVIGNDPKLRALTELMPNIVMPITTTDFDIDAAVAYLDANAASTWKSKCATYVREALEHGGLDCSDRPKSRYAKDWDSYMPKKGFDIVDKTDYKPVKGDIAVFQNYEGGHVAGHIQMYNGSKWVSDCVQPRFWPHRNAEKNPNYNIFRWRG